MALSKTDLAKETLWELGVIAEDETPSAAQASYVISKYNRVLERWRDEGLVFWDNATSNATEQIPEEVFDAVAKMLSGEVYRQFGFSEEKVARRNGMTMTVSELGYKELRAILSKRHENEPVRTESF
jgi:hypothetical protein